MMLYRAERHGISPEASWSSAWCIVFIAIESAEPAGMRGFQTKAGRVQDRNRRFRNRKNFERFWWCNPFPSLTTLRVRG
jgi:hypothetical protein